MDEAHRPVAVIVSVADDHLDQFAGVVAELRRAGLVVEDVLDTVGMVAGTIPERGMAALDAIPGVASVERQHAYRLPPPESEIQ